MLKMYDSSTINLKNNNCMTFHMYDFFLYFFMVLAMFIPTTYSYLRLIVLFCLFITSLIEYKRGKLLKIDKTGGIIFFTLLLYDLFCCLVGFLNGFSEGALRTLTVSFVWPVMYFCIFNLLNTEQSLIRLVKLMIFMEIIVAIFDIWYCISMLGFVSFPSILSSLDLDMHFGHYGSFIDYTTKHMCTLIFMVPFLAGLLTFETKPYLGSKHYIWLAYLLGIICAIFSGRAAFQVITALSIFYMLLIKYKLIFTSRKKKILLFFSLAIILMMVLVILQTIINKLDLDIWLIVDFVEGKFVNALTGSNNNLLYQQFFPLMNGWLDSPLFGNGAGAFLTEITRSDTMNWSYELGYCALLFQKGIIGFILFFALNIYTVKKLQKKMHQHILDRGIGTALILGLIAVLLSNTIDPYLGKMGCLWMEYLPFVIALNVNYNVKQY